MQTRQLARTGVQVSPLCLGAMMFGAWGEPDHEESIRIIHAALDAGINFIDTADVYSRGESEEIVGKALETKRDGVFLATKVHGKMHDEDPNWFGNSRRWITEEVENSLRRLRTDHIDLYQIHRPELDTDIDETLGALTDLVRAGKVRYIGSSTFPPSAVVEAQWVAERRGRERFVTEQPPYSILVREIERDLLPTCERHGMGVLPWSPLAGGWLTGRYRKGQDLPESRRAQLVPAPLRHVAAGEPGEARGRRRTGGARRRGGPDADRDVARLPARAPGGDRADHRPADDGAAGVDAPGGGGAAVRGRARPDRRDRAAGDDAQSGGQWVDGAGGCGCAVAAAEFAGAVAPPGLRRLRGGQVHKSQGPGLLARQSQ